VNSARLNVRKVVVLAGGTGGALLASGLQTMLPPGDLTVIANTADDDEFWGLLVSPDVDATIYRLAGVFNTEAGYGLKDDSFHVLEALGRLGEPTWFRIGDRDLATHVLRRDMLERGCRNTEAAIELCRRWGLHTRVLPMTDESVRTRFVTDRGELSFQEYFVRERLGPALQSIKLAGIEMAKPTPEVVFALAEAELVIIGPSNPLISVAPILRLVKAILPRERTVAITPLVDGVALKGPTVEMLRALGSEASTVEVARMYRDVAGGFVLDARDAGNASAIEELGYRVLVCNTVMDDGGARLAGAVLSEFGGASPGPA
jgi:LPPG:FO 2-phospho-L-lactate transferase